MPECFSAGLDPLLDPGAVLRQFKVLLFLPLSFLDLFPPPGLDDLELLLPLTRVVLDHMDSILVLRLVTVLLRPLLHLL